MKVLIISVFPPDPAPEADHALHLSEHLAKAGLAVHVLCRKGSITAAKENIVVHPLMHDWSWSELPRLVKCISECKPDVILLVYLGWIYDHHPMMTFFPSICKMVLPGVPCVTQFENIDAASHNGSFLARTLRAAIARWAGGQDKYHYFGTLLRDSSRIIALSSPHRARLSSHYPEVEEKCITLPSPPLIRLCSDDPAIARQRTRAAIGAADNDFVLIYWGYIYPGKGVETLLQAFRVVCSHRENIRLVLVGGTLEVPTPAGAISSRDYARTVQQLPGKLGIADKVTWTGHFAWDSDAGSRYLHAGDACILPFDWGVTLNNSSLAAASTHGLPVISTELAEGKDEALEHGRNIYLCPPRDAQKLAEAIQLVSENGDLRERLRAGIVRLALDWHRWDTMTERLVAVLESAASHVQVAAGNHLQSGIAAGDDVHLPPSVWSEENPPENGNAPLVSVIVAVYNVERYLTQCLDSLVNQTLKNIEIIVVNDASTDESLGIIKAYQSRYHNVRGVTCKKNLGLASVRNLGMKLAKGEYIGFVDGDDWADPRKYELMYGRAVRDKSDIVFGGIKPFVDDTKQFTPANDQSIWNALRPELKQGAFRATEEPRAFIIEPAVWAKLYKRSFLQEHALEFEPGMNSVEDVIFHFEVLWKANKISLLEAPVSFYRLTRAGQITGRKDRRVFEIITVFQKASQKLAAWNVPDEIWASLLSTELRFFNWLLRDRVSVHLKSEFFAECAKQLQKIPDPGVREFARTASAQDFIKVFCMRRNWRHAYNRLKGNRSPVFLLLYVMLRCRRREVLKRGLQHCNRLLRRQLLRVVGYIVNRLLNQSVLQKHVWAVQESVNQLTALTPFISELVNEERLTEVCRIDGHILFFADRSDRTALAHAVWRMENDYYLSQMAIFRDGDTVVDVGAHVGVVSIFLAKKYPFLRVYAIEPDPINYGCLKRNIELNGVTNVIAINKAVSGDGRKRTLYAKPSYSGWATIEPTMATQDRLLRAMPVESVTLQQVFEEYEIQHCRLLKITAPGAVRESLKAFTSRGCVDLICGEVDLNDCSRIALESESWRIARQFFWRTVSGQGNAIVHSWIHQLPSECEYRRASVVRTQHTPDDRRISGKQSASLESRSPFVLFV